MIFSVLNPLSSEFNHIRDTSGACVLAAGATPLPNEETCTPGQDYWYERTAYRKIPYSTCIGGKRPHEGPSHVCPGLKGHGFFFWLFVLFVPLALAGVIGHWIYRRSGLARGYVSEIDRY